MSSKVNPKFRLATRSDLPAIVQMLSEDDLGAQREHFEVPLSPSYYAAFEAITADPNHELIAAEMDGDVIGTLHLMYLPSISYQGRMRAQVESVRVESRLRGQGIGAEMMQWALERARGRGCHLMQLTSHKSREDAHRFYERLGFTKSHIGMKIML
ncbi:MAG: GNAT family N-acetyltransferase [Anaerolineales bacterium]|jgi:GNAT superfamily N-acetyltransferase